MAKTHINKDDSQQLLRQYIDSSPLSDVTKEMIANFALEGIYPTKETLKYLILLDKGEITEEQFFEKAMSGLRS